MAAWFHCSLDSNRCPPIAGSCRRSHLSFARWPLACAGVALVAGTKSPCWPPGRWTRICGRCWAPGRATAAPSSATATCRSVPSGRRSRRSRPHRPPDPVRSPPLLATEASLPAVWEGWWGWWWGIVWRSRAWCTKELKSEKWQWINKQWTLVS